jgi:hypothetical protein
VVTSRLPARSRPTPDLELDVGGLRPVRTYRGRGSPTEMGQAGAGRDAARGEPRGVSQLDGGDVLTADLDS